MTGRLTYRAALLWGLIAVTLILGIYGRDIAQALDMRWLVKYPSAWVIPFKNYITAAMKWLVEDAQLGPVAFTDITRAIAWMIEVPYDFVVSLLATGFLSGQGSSATVIVPAISWITVTAAVMALGHYCRDWPLALLVGGCFLYLAIFGQWDSAMVTLASVIIAVPIGAGGGLLIGIWAYRHPVGERVLSPILDLMQTIPIFAYLVPILFMFGFGPVSALVATIIYATPPMIRITTLALKGVDPEVVDFGRMAGSTPQQLMWRILVPSALKSIMVGVNQVIMLTLNMVIIASMIGAGGLGFDVLAALRRLDIGAGFEAGIAIVVLAIAVDRLSQAFAERAGQVVPSATGHNWFSRHKRTTLVLGLLVITFALGRIAPALQSYPDSQTITTGAFWDDVVRYLNINYFDTFEAIKVFFLTWFLLPIKRVLLGIPWPWAIAMLTLIGWRAGGVKLALLCGVLSALIVINGLWAKAMVTVYLCGASVIIATLIGVPLGVLAALNRRAGQVIGVFIDTLQTLPSFVYLIPVVMLFRVGDFTAMVAIVLCALAPAVRYAAHGVRSVSEDLIEAGRVSGCTNSQLLRLIRLPMALPEILLGINQTIMLALSMLVITALVGTRDLGQEVYIALTKADTGRGLVAGLAIAFIAIIADRLISASARGARIRFGMEKAR
ncbi:ABC transporter permease [Aliiroseovarius sp. YM-037]|uniref:ABC transporter permease n=1 Tax=Aliiroseovarius sp. YM-037 TaxID=3341728 RepID=UPI003A808F07